MEPNENEIEPSLRIAELITRYLREDLNEAENAELFSWVAKDARNMLFFNSLLNEENAEADGRKYRRIDVEKARQLVIDKLFSAEATDSPVLNRFRKRIASIAAAATILLVSGLSIWFYNSQQQSRAERKEVVKINHITPGSNKATLTLANGEIINLSGVQSGVIIGHKNLKYFDSTVVKVGVNSVWGNKQQQNKQSNPILTAKTPRGGTYQFRLPDGTRVWLNADSKLEFQSDFGKPTQRKVWLTGEAYFEVAKVKDRPFIVQTVNQQVKVLGTHFNISSYSDDRVTKTTLVEGSVQISIFPNGKNGKKSHVILKPNQQATLTQNNQLQVENVNLSTSSSIAWRVGEFGFLHETLESILRRAGRWYDVEIVYENKELGNDTYGAILTRDMDITKLLETLEDLNDYVKFKISGRKVIVLKK